jgi:uncharacterized protein (TIGR00369 family)
MPHSQLRTLGGFARRNGEGMKKGSKQAAGHGANQPPKKNFCFGCGRDNSDGMHLKFALDETGKQFVCQFRLGRRYTGPPDHCHGGVIATILDEAMSKLNRLFDAPAPTSRLTVEYLRPVPLHRPLEVWSKNLSKRGRRLTHAAEIRDQNGTVLARSRGVFVIISAQHVFGSRK